MSEVRLVVAILVPAIFTLILKDFFDLFMTNRYEGKVKQYTIWMLYLNCPLCQGHFELV